MPQVSEGYIVRRVSELDCAKDNGSTIGIGDDCAVLQPCADQRQLVTTDHLVQDVHFLLDHIPPKALGHKVLAVNLSDIAAKGGVAQYAFLNLALPSNLDQFWMEEFFAGFDELACRYDVRLLGGNTTASKVGVVVGATIIGRLARELKLRSACEAGDVLCVTDHLGDSRAGLQIALARRSAQNASEELLLRRHYWPEPELAAGEFLAAQNGVHALMDLSDGLLTDSGRMVRSAQLGARLRLEKLPLSPALVEFCSIDRGSGIYNAAEMALLGGEDYCLLAAVAAEDFASISAAFESRFNRKLFSVGEVTKAKGEIELTLDGSPYHTKAHGFEHFE